MDIQGLRQKSARHAIGLMSGTSCDGVDAALVRIKGTGPDLHVKLIHFMDFPYTPLFRTRLLSPRLDARDVCELNVELGERFAQAVSEVMRVAAEHGVEVDFVASHGHTLAHLPPGGKATRGAVGTLQVGEPAIIAERTGLPVVSDFRPRDMAAGGHGAPLAPYVHWQLFRRPDRTSACLNIGGIANITVVPPDVADLIAFDTGPGNMIIDGAIRLLSRGTLEMDKDGETAARGVVVDEFLDYLLTHPFFDEAPPKSTGREEFGTEVYLRDALMARKEHSTEDLLATVTCAVAYSVVRAFNRFIKPRYDVTRLILSGGGAFNKTLVRRIRQGLPDIVVRTTDEYGIPVEAVEAVAFAILGNETICGTPANVPQVTGARHPVLLGKITPTLPPG